MPNPVRGLDGFLAGIDAYVDAIPGVVRDLQLDLVEFGIDLLAVRSPVDTGAYRASHTVARGPDRPRETLWEAPSRPAFRPPPGGRPLDEPIGADARAVLEDVVGAFETLWLRNAVVARPGAAPEESYASWVEYGTALIAPRFVYGGVAADLAAVAEGLASEAQKRLEAAP